MSARALKDLQEASAHALSIVSEAGLTVQHGEQPTREQVALAALHGREDAALAIALLTKILMRMDEASPALIWRRLGVVFWWAGAILALPTLGIAPLVLFWPLAYVLAGTYWKPPRAD